MTLEVDLPDDLDVWVHERSDDLKFRDISSYIGMLVERDRQRACSIYPGGINKHGTVTSRKKATKRVNYAPLGEGILKMRGEGMSITRIAEAVGGTPSGVYYFLKGRKGVKQ